MDPLAPVRDIDAEALPKQLGLSARISGMARNSHPERKGNGNAELTEKH